MEAGMQMTRIIGDPGGRVQSFLENREGFLLIRLQGSLSGEQLRGGTSMIVESSRIRRRYLCWNTHSAITRCC
eukprot:scaffold2351_cov403-Prasinococcus_capsulatus_cf.AAC.4